MKNSPLVSLLVALCIIAAAAWLTWEPDGQKVKFVHTVRAGQTAWTIAAQYADRNTAGPFYLPKFLHELRENNPEVMANNRALQAGDKLVIVLDVK